MDKQRKGKRKKDIIAIVDAPKISSSECKKFDDVLINFFEALGWNSETELIDSHKVLTTKKVYDMLYNALYEILPHSVPVSVWMEENGPQVDKDIPEGKVYLLRDWTISDDKKED